MPLTHLFCALCHDLPPLEKLNHGFVLISNQANYEVLEMFINRLNFVKQGLSENCSLSHFFIYNFRQLIIEMLDVTGPTIKQFSFYRKPVVNNLKLFKKIQKLTGTLLYKLNYYNLCFLQPSKPSYSISSIKQYYLQVVSNKGRNVTVAVICLITDLISSCMAF